jgi:hypothetical protein
MQNKGSFVFKFSSLSLQAQSCLLTSEDLFTLCLYFFTRLCYQTISFRMVFCIHAFQLYTTSNEVTSQPKYISSSQLIEFLFHMNNHAYNLVHIFLCHPLLTIFKPVKKTRSSKFFSFLRMY